MTQRQKVGNCLKQAGSWINKIKIRELTGAEDVPTRVWELINVDHWTIASKKSPINDCQDYKFISENKEIEVKPQGHDCFVGTSYHYDNYLKEKCSHCTDYCEPVQQQFI